MPRLTLGIAAAAALILGIWLIRFTIPKDETGVINAFAAQYVRDTGGRLDHCVGRPSEVAHLWVYVVCRPPTGAPVVYLVNHRGRAVKEPSLARIVAAQG
ncbi:MAG: hypothetical protein AAF761_07690 [Pseudomonadota bacterium]